MYEARIKLAKLNQEKSDGIPNQLKEYYDEQTNVKFQENDFNSLQEKIKKEIFEDYRHDYFVNQIMEELKPKTSFIPQNPYKTLVGIVEPEDLEGVSKVWKQKFKTTYGHEILEDEDIVQERQKKLMQKMQ
ncbi:hypothetical protein IMG5_055000 [Ichthyophthirius multifiliis]|uniref:PX domain-containing protein n=1 Tax=Ichthyophthirius multifiliis TaxID=5932 RepID=G0QN29_ICHMU|nr:hypothetical protein IMG5_055000 [Ichthyophthirius multifiliis]EGR33358.1 hypothetical protein IMG5_055000 [Ichthyophthirius multifiliis]|eukprot:XP_004037344.1 hypothetical protein IMG5_055000 [Ichthyophthirius multifiliis]